MSDDKSNSYYFFSDGEIIEEVDANTDPEALMELWKRGYLVSEFFDYYVRFNRHTKDMQLFKVK